MNFDEAVLAILHSHSEMVGDYIYHENAIPEKRFDDVIEELKNYLVAYVTIAQEEKNENNKPCDWDSIRIAK